MHKVTVDGVDYFPMTDTSSKIGVAVSTYNRPDVLARTLDKIIEFTPAAYIAVVDDASPEPVDVPEGVHLIRNEKNSGIAYTKNRGIEALMDEGCTQLFLFDDDVYPVKDDWWVPYVDSPEPHLMYMFRTYSGNKVVYSDDEVIAYSSPQGVMLYADRSVVEAVGGMDTVYGRWGGEHGDWSDRIHHEGLTSWRYADVKNSEGLFYSLDEHQKISRSVPQAERDKLFATNDKIQEKRKDRWERRYFPYRETRNVVISSLLNSTKDPQRDKFLGSGIDLAKTWYQSIQGATPVLHVDHEVKMVPNYLEIVKVPASDMNLYHRMFLLAYRYLRDHPEVDKVWVTDATDVDMLREPWDEMEPGKIYVGSENRLLDNEWMRHHHRALPFQILFDDNPDNILLNSGLLGGNREDVMMYCHMVYRLWADMSSKITKVPENSEAPTLDMGAFNYVGYTEFSDKLEYGPKVHTVFKAEEKNNNWSWWRHK